MDKNIKNIEYNNKDRQNNFNNKKSIIEKSNISNNNSMDKSGITSNNIFLSLPKINALEQHKFNKIFQKTLNLSIKNKRNKTKDSFNSEIFELKMNTITIPNKKINNLINNTIVNNQKNLQKKRYKILFEDIHKNSIYNNLNDANIKIIYRNILKNDKYQDTNVLRPIINKSCDKKNAKTQKFEFFQKKSSIEYISPIYNNIKAFLDKDEPNLKRLNLYELMKKGLKRKNKKNNICLLSFDDNNKCQNDIISKQYFRIGDKFSPEEKIKNLNERNEYYSKVKTLYEDKKDSKIKKKLSPFRNCHEILEHYKKNRVTNCKKLVEQTLLDVKREKNSINEFFDKYKKVFDEYDDWNDPKNNDNLYNL